MSPFCRCPSDWKQCQPRARRRPIPANVRTPRRERGQGHPIAFAPRPAVGRANALATESVDACGPYSVSGSVNISRVTKQAAWMSSAARRWSTAGIWPWAISLRRFMPNGSHKR